MHTAVLNHPKSDKTMWRIWEDFGRLRLIPHNRRAKMIQVFSPCHLPYSTAHKQFLKLARPLAEHARDTRVPSLNTREDASDYRVVIETQRGLAFTASVRVNDSPAFRYSGDHACLEVASSLWTARPVKRNELRPEKKVRTRTCKYPGYHTGTNVYEHVGPRLNGRCLQWK